LGRTFVYYWKEFFNPRKTWDNPVATFYESAQRVTFLDMKFENDKGEPVEINFQNVERILPGNQAGFTPVKLKNGREECVLATEK
jgi:hypothetical protein